MVESIPFNYAHAVNAFWPTARRPCACIQPCDHAAAVTNMNQGTIRTIRTSTSQSRPSKRYFDFLGLPRELRNEIYVYAFLRHDKIEEQKTRDYTWIQTSARRWMPVDMTILHINKQVHDEAKELLRSAILKASAKGTHLFLTMTSFSPHFDSSSYVPHVTGTVLNMARIHLCNFREEKLSVAPELEGVLSTLALWTVGDKLLNIFDFLQSDLPIRSQFFGWPKCGKIGTFTFLHGWMNTTLRLNKYGNLRTRPSDLGKIELSRLKL
jgi:hypothetical protein